MFALVAHYWYAWLILAFCGLGLMVSAIGGSSARKEAEKRLGGSPHVVGHAVFRAEVEKILLKREKNVPRFIHDGGPVMLVVGLVMAIFAGVLKFSGY